MEAIGSLGSSALAEAARVRQAFAAYGDAMRSFSDEISQLSGLSAFQSATDQLRDSLDRALNTLTATLTTGARAAITRTGGTLMSAEEARAKALSQPNTVAGRLLATDLLNYAAEVEKLNLLFAEGNRRLLERAVREQTMFRLSLEEREARVRGEDAYAASVARAIAREEELADARARGIPDELIERLKELQKAEEAAATAAAALALQQTREDLQVRALVAQGMDEEAAAMRRKLDQERELAGITDEATRRLLQHVHALEDQAYATAQAAAAAERLVAAQIAAARAQEDIAIEILRLKGLNAEADEAALRQQRADRIAAAGENVTLLGLIEEWFSLSLAKLQPVAVRGGATSATASVQATVTERTAYQLVDINRSQLVVLRQIDRGIRWLGGRRGLSQGVDEDMADSAVLFGFNAGSVGRN